MNTKYIDLINQTFDFPQDEFILDKNQLQFHGIDLNELVQTYGAPLKFTYLPKISDNIKRSKGITTNLTRLFSPFRSFVTTHK